VRKWGDVETGGRLRGGREVEKERQKEKSKRNKDRKRDGRGRVFFSRS